MYTILEAHTQIDNTQTHTSPSNKHTHTHLDRHHPHPRLQLLNRQAPQAKVGQAGFPAPLAEAEEGVDVGLFVCVVVRVCEFVESKIEEHDCDRTCGWVADDSIDRPISIGTQTHARRPTYS